MKKKRGNIAKVIRRTILTLSCITFIVVTGIFVVQVYAEKRSSDNMKKVQDMASVSVVTSPQAAVSEQGDDKDTNLVTLKMEYLKKKNSDLSGWLRINGTSIDYPVMYTEGDNDYYLEHDFFKNPDRNGLLVLDKRCSGDLSGNHILIHGHNMKSGAIFGSLKDYKDEASPPRSGPRCRPPSCRRR